MYLDICVILNGGLIMFYFLIVCLFVIIYFICKFVNLYVFENVCNKNVLLYFCCKVSVFG